MTSSRAQDFSAEGASASSQDVRPKPMTTGAMEKCADTQALLTARIAREQRFKQRRRDSIKDDIRRRARRIQGESPAVAQIRLKPRQGAVARLRRTLPEVGRALAE